MARQERAAAVLHRAIRQATGEPQVQQQCATLLGQALRGQAAAAVQPCGAQLSLLPRLRLTQPLRSQALNGRRHMLPVNPSNSSSSSTVGRALHSGMSSSSRQLLQPGGRQAAWRGWVQQQLGGSSASSSSSSGSRVFLRLRSGFSSAAASAPGSKAAAATLPSWGAAGGVASWFNNMPAAAAWWDSWMLWVGSQASFVMATLLNSLNTVGNKLPVALGLLLVDWVHHSPLLHGSRADALHPPALLDKLPEGGFYATTKAAGGSSSSSLWRSTARGAAAAWGELLAGLSAGARLLWLGCIWLPALLSAPLMLGCCGPTGRSWWLGLITLSLEASGPAFIKWGQWAATRHDLFAHDVCEALEKLHTQAPAHSFRYTCMALHKSFDLPPDQLFDWIEEVPIACGSIGQVHRARLSEKGAALACCDPGEVVAVKVRHPGVSEAIERDFQTMVWVAHAATQLFPSIRSLRLEDTLKQFAAPLHEQVDLSREASNLQRFNTNFRRARGVSFPMPLYPLVSPDVLVESFEDGKHISAYITGAATGSDPYRARLAELGSGTMLQMMLVDNLIHSDLHPGNILVRLEQPHGLVGVAYNAVNALANPDGLPMKALGSALQQLDTKRQPGGGSSSGSSNDDDGVVEVVAVEVLESPSTTSSSAGQQQDKVASSSSGGSSSGSDSARRRGVFELVRQLRSAWCAGGAAGLQEALQARLRGVAAGWLQPHIVLLDVGMATELSPEDQTNMVGLFRAFAALDGRNVARWTLRFSGTDQACEDPQAFIEDMDSTFETLKKTIAAQEVARIRWEAQESARQQQQQQQRQDEAGSSGGGVSGSDSGTSSSSSAGSVSSGLIEMPEQFDSGAEALSTVLELVRLHGVSLPGTIAGCVVTTLILEGWSNRLSPEHSVLRQVQSMFSPALLPWRSRIDSVVDTVMDRLDTAVALT